MMSSAEEEEKDLDVTDSGSPEESRAVASEVLEPEEESISEESTTCDVIEFLKQDLEAQTVDN